MKKKPQTAILRADEVEFRPKSSEFDKDLYNAKNQLAMKI